MIDNFKDVTEQIKNRFAESPLGKQLEEIEFPDSGDEADLPFDDGVLKPGSPMPSGDILYSVDKKNNNYVLDGITYKTDDNGSVYMADGKLAPNTTYELNGNIYTTDDKGRIIRCEAKPQHSPENPRDNNAQRDAGGNDRRPGDQGGHIVGRDLNGDSGGGNLIAMDSKINQSDYKRMENEIKEALDDGKEVTTKTEMTYEGDSERPDRITVTVTADSKDTVYTFDNNMEGSLIDKVPENGKEAVQEELNDTNGKISSIKEEYSEDGNLVKTTVNITYADDDGSTHRTKVVINNTQGGDN